MAKVSWQDIGELSAVDTASIGKAIIVPAKEALRQTRFALGGNLTIRDNMYAAIVTLGYSGNSTQTLTTGIEYTFQNPLKTKPVGFTPISSIQPDGSPALGVDSFDINNSRTDGLTGITIGFRPPSGFVSLLRNSTFTAASGGQVVQWDAEDQPLSGSGVFSYDTATTSGTPPINSRINCGADGIVMVTGQVFFTTSALGNERDVWVQKNNSTSSRWGAQRGPFGSVATAICVASQVEVLAGDYLQIMAFQDTGAGLALVSSASVSRPNQIQCSYVRPLPTYSAIVTGILWGG